MQITEEATLKNRQLTKVALSLQRSSGQFYVLEDPSLIKRLEKSHQHFQDIVFRLRTIPFDENQTSILDDLIAQESDLFLRLKSNRSSGPDGFETFKRDFDRLHESVAGLNEKLSKVIQRQQTILHKTTNQARQTMIWQSTVVILLSLILAAVLSWLLSRPVRQLSQSIGRLGNDDLETPVQVTGPQDMVSLGHQLDWLRQRLVELEEQKQRFFRQVSHELKTPLTALWEAVDLLSDKVAGNLSNQQQEIVEIMHGSVRVLRQRIEELLHYQQALHHTKNRNLSSISLSSLIKSATRNFDLSLKAKHLTLLNRSTGIILQADKGQMEIIFNNLISNAIHFSPDGSMIEVSAEYFEDKIQITVCDQGVGVPPEDRPHIFQPFYQGANQTSSRIAGSGLGLAIAKAHVEAHGGELILKDEIITGGTCFLIRLPHDKEKLNNDC
jgi:two-component system, NtrC family, sensor histidine kinase GlrK